MNNAELISREALKKDMCKMCNEDYSDEPCEPSDCVFFNAIKNAPAVDAVPVEQYNELRDDFIDYVCSGVPNPAPYCGNAMEKCVDVRGWCVNSECKGFATRVERKE